MPRYKNIEKLLEGTENLPEIVDRGSRFDPTSFYDDLNATTPKYNKFLQNARRQVISDYRDQYQNQPDYIPDTKAAEDLYNALTIPSINPQSPNREFQEQSKLYQQIVDTNKIKKNPEIVDTIKRRLSIDDNIIDRTDINAKIIEAYIKDKFPEYAFNRTLPNAKSEDMDYTNKMNLLRIGKDITGQEFDPSKLFIDRDMIGHGGFYPETGEVVIKDPTNVKTIAHELLHVKNPISHSNENMPEFFNDEVNKKLDANVRKAQKGHIPYYGNFKKEIIDNQNYDFDDRRSEGESGFYYDRIKEYLKTGK